MASILHKNLYLELSVVLEKPFFKASLEQSFLTSNTFLNLLKITLPNPLSYLDLLKSITTRKLL